jgi:hypothetical protein
MVWASTTDQGDAEEANRAERSQAHESPCECGQQTRLTGIGMTQVLSLRRPRRGWRP